MKRLIVLLLLLLPLGAFAQEVKIAYVNVNEVMMALPDVSNMERDIAALNEKYTAEMKLLENDYQKKAADYVAQQDSLTENIKLRRMQDIEDLRTKMENFGQIAQQDVQKKYEELFQPIQQKVQNAIKAIGDEKGYTYIFNNNGLLYISPNATDATPFVRTKLGL
ncbi:MAG: OmpH family outer membrane protein [Tannerellaceae bacterium]|jgi:outer membrane protein|nr:OmpH family outer membrane protein [Tannerellaceae bacterium]